MKRFAIVILTACSLGGCNNSNPATTAAVLGCTVTELQSIVPAATASGQTNAQKAVAAGAAAIGAGLSPPCQAAIAAATSP